MHHFPKSKMANATIVGKRQAHISRIVTDISTVFADVWRHSDRPRLTGINTYVEYNMAATAILNFY